MTLTAETAARVAEVNPQAAFIALAVGALIVVALAVYFSVKR